MSHHRKLVGTLTILSLAAMPLVGAAPAHAAVGGTIKGGPGGTGCASTVTCLTWFEGCAHKDVTQNANDLDASIRFVGNLTRTVNYSWSAPQEGSVTALEIEGYDSNCSIVRGMDFEKTAHSGSLTLDSRVAYVFVTGSGPFVNLAWSLG
jgi:hypothetical protein